VQLALLSLSLLTGTHTISYFIFPSKSSSNAQALYHPGVHSNIPTPQGQRENATFVMLARNQDVEDAMNAVRAMEDRFNRNHNYPWVFLNDQPFSDEFILCVVQSHFNPLQFLSMHRVCTDTPRAQVACRMSSLVPHILGRSPTNTGVSHRGSTKPRRRRSEGR
jgi:hypothetical protein